ncbi:MAG: adenylate/guanylate cyclase domain-containing protein [Candidatus Binatia bacterium]
MKCPNCSTDNPSGAKFCNECAAPLPLLCPSCGTENPPGAKFCNECATPIAKGTTAKRGNGEEEKDKRIRDKWIKEETEPQPPVSYTPVHLAERIQAEREAMEARGASEGERKSITALFVDIKGSTDIIAELDPEEAQAIIDPTLQLMMDAVHRYEGYVAQALGDGIFALFGAPIAHEDHPQRALYAALLMQEESRKRAEQLRREKGVNLQIRVGINTGEVVLRSIRKDDLQTDYVPVGQSTNLASRMESLATPGTILVSEQTYRLTEGYFEFKPLGKAQVKGFAEPLNIYEVVGVGPLRTKLQLSVRRGLARFVGRQHEMALLQQAWESAKTGHGQIAAVMGEPGVGKSRLFYEFKLLSQRGCLVLETFSVSHGKAYPYLPLIDLLKNYFQLTNQDNERRRREKITGKVLTLDRSLEDTLPYLFFLLGIAKPTSPLQQMDGQIRRKRILEAIKRLFLRESLNQPLIVIFEDLHWLDGETQAFLQLLSESVATARILLLVNYRPEYQHSWSGKTYFSQVRLDPLSKEQAEEMLTALLEDAFESPLPRRERARVRVSNESLEPLKKFILAKTEGNPFFMEEIVQELREQGLLNCDDVGARRAVPLPQDLRLPTTVEGVLTARMDRLPAEEKALLQTLAVIGREFSSSLLRKVVTQPEATLLRLLSRLQASEFVYEQPAFPEPEYIFKHALTQEVAYNSLLIERRKVLHERTAQAMEEVYHDKLDDHYSELAYHYSRSGNTQKAVDYLQLAGQQAVQRSAYNEAINHLTKGLDLLQTMPGSSARVQQELALQLVLGNVLMATKGYAAPEVEQVYLRARELCHQCGDSVRIFPALFGLWIFFCLHGEVRSAKEIAEQMLNLAEKENEPEFLVEAFRADGITEMYMGEFLSARRAFERGLSLYDPQKHSSHAFSYGHDPSIASLNFLAWTLWYLGYPDQAQQRIYEARQRALELGHPFSLVFVLGCGLFLHQLCGDIMVTLQWEEEAEALYAEHTFPMWESWSIVTRGWILAERNETISGIELIRQGITASRATGDELSAPQWLTVLATTCWKAGYTAQGLATVAEGLGIADKSRNVFSEAELYRLKGELTLQKFQVSSSKFQVPPSPQPPVPSSQAEVEREAEECFLKAIAIAQKQQAKSLELRAVMSLVRLRQQQAVQSESRITSDVVRSRLTQAHQMLSAVYHWFTEGFDTKNLQEAKALIESLSH